MISVFGSEQAQKKSVIDLTDKELQLAHELCETAAYQALRIGNCVSRIDNAVNNLERLLTTANNEVQRLTEQKLPQTTEEETFTSTPARLARVAAVATREPSTVRPSIIEINEASYLSAESVTRLKLLRLASEFNIETDGHGLPDMISRLFPDMSRLLMHLWQISDSKTSV
jgi:hypothetical protein